MRTSPLIRAPPSPVSIVTPPLASGLLPGVMRGVLLDDPAWGAAERILSRDDLCRAQEVVVCNALRGILPATVDWATRA